MQKGKWGDTTAIILAGPKAIIADINMTIQSVIDNAEGPLAVTVVLDGFTGKADILKEHKGITVDFIEFAKCVGQRVGLNAAVSACKTKFFCRLDCHCTMSPRWDSELKLSLGYKADLSFPAIHPLNAAGTTKITSYGFVEITDNGHLRWYHKKGNPKNAIEKSMSLTGCGWMMSKAGYEAMGGMDESLSIWGGQGLELSLKVKRKKGRIWLNKNVICGHRFNTPRTGYTKRDVELTRAKLIEMYQAEFKQLKEEFQ